MDFTNKPGPQKVNLATGTDDIVGTLGTIGTNGRAFRIMCSVKCVSGSVTNFKAKLQTDPLFGFEDFLEGSDWISQNNGAQRDWTSENSPSSLSAGKTSYFTIIALYAQMWQFVASGDAGTELIVNFEPIFDKSQR